MEKITWFSVMITTFVSCTDLYSRIYSNSFTLGCTAPTRSECFFEMLPSLHRFENLDEA